MGMNDTPASERIHIAFFGCRNAGKSSLINAVTGQQLSVVSSVAGTTTDAVHKTMELLPAGPVVITDTPGLDDEGTLGKMRVEAALAVLRTTDVAVLVVDASKGLGEEDKKIIQLIEEKNIPYITAMNKADLVEMAGGAAGAAGGAAAGKAGIVARADADGAGAAGGAAAGGAISSSGLIYVSAVTGVGINELKEEIAKVARGKQAEKPIVGDLAYAGAYVLLVVPIDKAAPRGRLILPQQQVIRDLLDMGAVPVIAKDSELPQVISELGDRLALVITDSQVFGKVAGLVPESIPLTSFSILFSRYKGELEYQLQGLEAIKGLQDGDTVLISEGCTHHRQCGDIGTVKIPAVLRRFTGKSINIETTSGKDFPTDLSKYKVVIHCGGCMLTEKEMKERIYTARAQGVPITNYGMVLALGSGILARSVKPLGIEL